MGLRSRSGKGAKGSAASNKNAKDKLNVSTNNESTTAEVERQTSDQSLWKKVFARGLELTPEESLRATHWLRQAFGVIFGITCGLARLTGSPVVISFLIASFSGPPAFLSMLHDIDIDEVSKVGTIQIEGLLPSVALFLLSWIITYTIRLPPKTA